MNALPLGIVPGALIARVSHHGGGGVDTAVYMAWVEQTRGPGSGSRSGLPSAPIRSAVSWTL
ncbi:hypothetical protein WJ438_08370 [Streptomyces sp. GD-15H]|uniref:hypothetical protein n=1 Tax=Streptomyces sp. GD-15H TaxID=3129112 RepID=UPI0032473D54